MLLPNISCNGHLISYNPPPTQRVIGRAVIPSWKDPATQDLWTLTASEIALLPGMTDKGRLGFAVQLKFMQVHGRFPEHHDEIDPTPADSRIIFSPCVARLAFATRRVSAISTT